MDLRVVAFAIVAIVAIVGGVCRHMCAGLARLRIIICGPRFAPAGGGQKLRTREKPTVDEWSLSLSHPPPPSTHTLPPYFHTRRLALGGEPEWPSAVLARYKERYALSSATKATILARHKSDPACWPEQSQLLLLSVEHLCDVVLDYFPDIEPRPMAIPNVSQSNSQSNWTIPRKWMVYILLARSDKVWAAERPDTGVGGAGKSRRSHPAEQGVSYNGTHYTSEQWQKFAIVDGADDWARIRQFGGLTSVFSDRRVVEFKNIFEKVRSFGLESEAIASAVIVNLCAVPALATLRFKAVGTTRGYDLHVDCPGTCVEAFLRQLRLDSGSISALIKKRK